MIRRNRSIGWSIAPGVRAWVTAAAAVMLVAGFLGSGPSAAAEDGLEIARSPAVAVEENTEEVTPAYSGRRFAFFQFNMAGAARNKGTYGVADAVVRSVRDKYPYVVTLNEVCYRQYARIRDALDGNGYEGRFGYTVTGVTNCAGGSYGNAIFVRDDITTLDHKWLYDNDYERRKASCVKVRRYNFAACVTHIDYHSYGQWTQITQVKNLAAGYRNRGWHTVVGGDFNVTPNDNKLDQVYHSCYPGGANGIFHEVDTSWCGSRGGEGTHSRGKIDYLFITPGFDSPNGDATYSDYSDHDPLWGWASLTWSELG